MKEKIIGALGGFGYLLWGLISIVFVILPMSILRFPWWATFIAVAIVQIEGIGTVVHLGLSIWALTQAIHLEQNWVVIAFYITFGLQVLLFIPGIISMLIPPKNKSDY